MARRLFLLIPFLLGILTIGLVTAAPALQGNHRTFATLIQKAAPPLPDEPLLLVRQATGLVWVNPTNTLQRQLTTNGGNGNAIVSPDGAWVIYAERGNQSPSDTLLIPAAGGTPRVIPGGSRRRWSFDSAYLSSEGFNNTSYSVSTYHIATGAVSVIDRDGDNNHAWHPHTNQIYFAPYQGADREDVSIYRSNADGSGRIPILETPNFEWLFTTIPDGRLIVSAYNPTRYIITSVNGDGTNPVVLKDLPRGVIVVNVSPYGTGFFYQLDDVLYLDDGAGQAVQQLTPPCAAPNGECFHSSVQWRSDGGQLSFRWRYRVSSDYIYTLYTLDQTPTATPRVIDSGSVGNALYSPDGRYLAYQKGRGIAIIYDLVAGQVAATLPDTDIQMWRP